MRPWVDGDVADYGRAFPVQMQANFEWMPWKRPFHPIHNHTLDAVFPMGYSASIRGL
jgi:hypothetical protein